MENDGGEVMIFVDCICGKSIINRGFHRRKIMIKIKEGKTGVGI
jgi:hypothetical protein